MNMFILLLSIFVASLLWVIFRGYLARSTLDRLPGPPSSSFLLGNIPEVTQRQSWRHWRTLVDTYGAVWKLHGILGAHMLHVSDPKALHSILVKDVELYPKSLSPSTDMYTFLGPGLLTTEGEQNRKQRKLLNPVFSVAHLRNMTHIFYEITRKLVVAIEARIGEESAVIDINGWMARAALELLGQAGLGYSFDSFVEDSTDEFGESVKMFFPVLGRIAPLSLIIPKISYVLPEWLILKLLAVMPHSDTRRMVAISDMMARRSWEIIQERKAALSQEETSLAHRVGEGKDIMSLLLKANLAASEAEKHTDEELIAQMSTLILGGMDTTSNALSRILHLLSENRSVQDKLRTEIVEAGAADSLDHDDLVKLPYLDAVCRETLRLYAPAQFIVREAAKDTYLPLTTPVRSLDGTVMTEVPVPRGTVMILNLTGCNTDFELWGEDAYEWKPERWLGPPTQALENSRVPGVYSNLMTFSGGVRSCIGFKFSQLEMKVVLSVLLTAFRFEMTDKPIAWNSSAVAYPTTGEQSAKPEMLLRVVRVS
ncbi:cytochrome P450 [Trametes maxima]|nr:cytochrome P450 [Trametes maxima]